MINKKRDGHVHSHYCPHGSKDAFEMYLDNAIKKGIEEITFTEHMPMPEGVIEEFAKSCSPNIENIEKYFEEIKHLKEEYKDKIKVNCGLEVDFIEGYEEFTRNLLNEYGQKLDDSILSVHFCKYKNKYYPIDCIEYFEELLQEVNSIEAIYDMYYDTLLKAIKSDLGKYKPRRIGHPTLIRIFNKKYPLEYKNTEKFNELIMEIKNRGYELDCNTAGLRKQLCGEVYPSGEFYDLAIENNINLVYGSDSHVAKDVGYEFI